MWKQHWHTVLDILTYTNTLLSASFTWKLPRAMTKAKTKPSLNCRCMHDNFVGFLSKNLQIIFFAVIPTTTAASTSTTHSTTSNMGQQRIKVIIGCIGAFIGVVAAILIFFLIWKRKELKHQGLPRILQELNSPTEEQRHSALPLPVEFQNGHSLRDSLIPIIHKRNSSYRSQLSSSASGGTILTFADGTLSYCTCQ